MFQVRFRTFKTEKHTSKSYSKTSKPLIKITNIKRDFVLGNEIVYVLKGIDLEIKKGEYVALMGPSGSGKSTLMNLLGCLDTPTSGTYILNGKDVSQMHDDELADIRNKEIGLYFSNFQPFAKNHRARQRGLADDLCWIFQSRKKRKKTPTVLH